ncbi:MAG: lytic transglycosylase domain-containing protein [SAR324 cluster bacterium]|nr:lytic transglycosylase domain-containing protein [SAR324 cluster bacterium]
MLKPLTLPLILLMALAASSCATSRYGRPIAVSRAAVARSGVEFSTGGHGVNNYGVNNYVAGRLKDNKPSIWVSNHPRVARFHNYYNRTITVEKALLRGQRYLPTITRVFRARRLPLELAYLPMLESVFVNEADSGSAKGLWQFTRQTAREMGLRVSGFIDERLDWYKATLAAADYLERLGKRFNYNWALALAAYNGGPGYIQRQMKKQGTWDFYRLRLRKETYDYVPKFIAMVQVAKEKYVHLLVAGR